MYPGLGLFHLTQCPLGSSRLSQMIGFQPHLCKLYLFLFFKGREKRRKRIRNKLSKNAKQRLKKNTTRVQIATSLDSEGMTVNSCANKSIPHTEKCSSGGDQRATVRERENETSKQNERGTYKKSVG